MKALYAGSFDPITKGHLDIIFRASKLCDELVVGVITNPSKKSMYSIDERMSLIREVTRELCNVKVDSFGGLLAEYVNKKSFDLVVRGLRATTDFEIEMQMAQMNAKLYAEKVETVFLMTDPQYSFISSSMAKEVFCLGGNIGDLVPEKVLKFMENKKQEDKGVVKGGK